MKTRFWTGVATGAAISGILSYFGVIDLTPTGEILFSIIAFIIAMIVRD